MLGTRHEWGCARRARRSRRLCPNRCRNCKDDENRPENLSFTDCFLGYERAKEDRDDGIRVCVARDKTTGATLEKPNEKREAEERPRNDQAGQTLNSLLFDWQRLRLTDEGAVAADGGERLVRRIVQLVGGGGLRCTVAYAAIARLALSAQRGEHDQLETWRQVSGAVLELIG